MYRGRNTTVLGREGLLPPNEKEMKRRDRNHKGKEERDSGRRKNKFFSNREPKP